MGGGAGGTARVGRLGRATARIVILLHAPLSDSQGAALGPNAVHSVSVEEETIATGEDQGEELLDASDTKRYQSCAALLNYFCLDRSDVQFPVKELMRK